MSTLQSYIDPVSTNQIFNNLSSAIDESNLMTTLDNMSERIQRIEATKGASRRSELLRKEITILEVQINYIKDRASLS